jgi:hypothetical protein
MSAKLVQTRANRRVSRGQRGGSSMAVFSDFGAATFPSKYLLNYTHEAEWAPLQNQYFSENPVGKGIEPGPLDL